MFQSRYFVPQGDNKTILFRFSINIVSLKGLKNSANSIIIKTKVTSLI